MIQYSAYRGGFNLRRDKPAAQGVVEVAGETNSSPRFEKFDIHSVVVKALDDCVLTWWGEDPKLDGTCGEYVFAGEVIVIEIERGGVLKTLQLV